MDRLFHDDDESTPLVTTARVVHPTRGCTTSLRQLRRVFGYSLAWFVLGVVIGRNKTAPSTGPEETKPDVLPEPLLGRPRRSHHHHEEQVLDYSKISADDFGPYQEFSVVHSDRSLNLMSVPFQQAMQNLHELLLFTYQADKVAIIPGSGTFGMEAVARQLATDRHVMVLRNGYFSYRWTQIFEA